MSSIRSSSAFVLLFSAIAGTHGLAGEPVTEALLVAQAEPAIPALVSGQRVQVRKLTRDMAEMREGLVTSGPSPLQDPAEVQARQQRLAQFASALERYPQLDDPDVQAARAEYEALRQALSSEFQRSREQLAQLGDVQQVLAAIEANAASYPVPPPLVVPFSEAEARGWVEAASNARTVSEHASGQLSEIAALAWLPQNPGTPQAGAPYDQGDVDRLQRNAAAASTAVQENYQAMAQVLEERMRQAAQELSSRWQEDPQADETRWLFIADGQEQEARDVFDGARAVAKSSVYLEAALGREAATARDLISQADAAQREFERRRELAMESSRLPEPRSTDPELLAIARDILAKPQYEFGQHGRIVLTTAEMVERERKDGEIEFDKANLTLAGDLELSGTETTWTYRWQEFKFAVPLQETGSDRWYIWWITARNYSSGGEKTPLNQWVSGEAVRGNPILSDRI